MNKKLRLNIEYFQMLSFRCLFFSLYYFLRNNLKMRRDH